MSLTVVDVEKNTDPAADDPGAVGVCPYCHRVIYEAYSTHAWNCEEFKKHLGKNLRRKVERVNQR